MDEQSKMTRAAQYLRMSTDHQRYSIHNQANALAEFATRRGFEIVRTFSDAGKSGLSIDGREALQELIRTVQSGEADFEVILVYDVSRWGRFQDADESAYYEYLCKREGIRVLYCAEGFENDDSPIATIVKSVKRAMAGEFSRELSAKVFQGQCNLIQRGFRQGGAAGYGLRRLLVDANGVPKGVLRTGEQKSLNTDRVILVPGPTEERAVVREIYRLYVHERKSMAHIAAVLNEAGVPGEDGCAWKAFRVLQILRNEKYIGNNVFNRRSFKLKKRLVRNPESLWIRREAAFEPIVELEDFKAAQARFGKPSPQFSEAELLERLEALAATKGRLRAVDIETSEGMPRVRTYRRRFGGLEFAYQRIGHVEAGHLERMRTRRRLDAIKSRLVGDAVKAVEKQGGTAVRARRGGMLRVNGMLSVCIVVVRCRVTSRNGMRWVVPSSLCTPAGLPPDVVIAVRMNEPNEAPLDYYVLPSLDFRRTALVLKGDNGRFLDAYRRASLDSVFEVAQTARIGRAA